MTGSSPPSPEPGAAWPSEADRRLTEHPDYVHLCRVLAGMRRLSTTDRPTVTPGAAMSRETTRLVHVLGATQVRLGVLAVRLHDGTATTDEQREVADELDDVLDLLRSHAADVDAGIVAAPRRRSTPDREPA
jgi:proteasome lid subunit RPN8/RPN11